MSVTRGENWKAEGGRKKDRNSNEPEEEPDPDLTLVARVVDTEEEDDTLRHLSIVSFRFLCGERNRREETTREREEGERWDGTNGEQSRLSHAQKETANQQPREALHDAHAGLNEARGSQFPTAKKGKEGKAAHHHDCPGAANAADVPRGTAALEEEVAGDFEKAVCEESYRFVSFGPSDVLRRRCRGRHE